MEKKDFKVGQIVYLKIIEGSNAARYIDKSNIENWIKEKEISKIGNKYITVVNVNDLGYGEEKFDIQNHFCHYYTAGSRDYELFLSKQDILNDLNSEKLYDKVKNKFSSWKNSGKYTLEQLQTILDITESTIE